MLSWIAAGLTAWVAAAFAIAVLVGRIIEQRDRQVWDGEAVTATVHLPAPRPALDGTLRAASVAGRRGRQRLI